MKSFQASLFVLLVVLTMSFLFMCDKDSAATAPAASATLSKCDVTASGYCAESTTLDSASCTSFSGTYTAGTACSLTNAVGRCTNTAGNGTTWDKVYYSPTYTATTAQADCTGTFKQP